MGDVLIAQACEVSDEVHSYVARPANGLSAATTSQHGVDGDACGVGDGVENHRLGQERAALECEAGLKICDAGVQGGELDGDGA